MLSRRDHSELELKRKLLEKGGAADAVTTLLRELSEQRYLDDRKFAENFVRFRAGKAWGRRRYQQELFHRGVSPEVIQSVLATLPETNDEAIVEKLKALLERELLKGRSEKQILESFLRRGFSMDSIRKAKSELD